MENLTGGTPPVRYLPCVVPCKLYFNYVKRKSNWKDADFQTWRLILKRVLSNSAESLDDFIRSEEGGEFEIF